IGSRRRAATCAARAAPTSTAASAAGRRLPRASPRAARSWPSSGNHRACPTTSSVSPLPRPAASARRGCEGPSWRRARARRLAELHARAAALRARGVIFPARWLARRLARALEERIAALPAGAADALALLDLVDATGVVLDLSRAQIRALGWWREAPPAVRDAPVISRLCERLRIAPALNDE